MIFRITDDKKFIEVEAKGEKTEDFKAFCAKLPDGDCRYAVLDVEINTKSGATANKLIFVAWCALFLVGRTRFGMRAAGRPRECVQRHTGPVGARLTLAADFCSTFHRSDDNASIKPKMLYASSKDALKKTLTGINEEFQATDRGDLDEAEVKKKAGHV